MEEQNTLWTYLKVSLFQNNLTLGIAFAVVIHPTALLPGSLKHSVKSILQDYPRTQNKNVSARWKKNSFAISAATQARVLLI